MLKKSENRVKELLNTIESQGKKISEGETYIRRLETRNNQHKELTSKSGSKSESHSDRRARKKCRHENTGYCKKKNDCPDYHPKLTCQQFGKLGSCSFEACELRHPSTVCHEWKQTGWCRMGDQCRHRHPFETHLKGIYDQYFLYYTHQGMPGTREGWAQSRPGEWSQGPLHQDQSGGRY